MLAPYRHLALSRVDVAILASGALLFVPGLRVVWAWPWLWFVPGWFFASKVLRASGFLLVALSLALSIAFTSVVCLPLALAAGAPNVPVIVGSVAAFSVATALPWPTASLVWPDVRWPPRALLAALAFFFSFRAFDVIAWMDRLPSESDGWYFLGVVRELAARVPPSNPFAASRVLGQPWGYWFLYALSHVGSGLSPLASLHVASALLSIAFTAILYTVVASSTGDRRAASFAVVLALGSGGIGWLWRADLERAWITTFGENVVDGFYDLPVFVVVLAICFFLSCAKTAGPSSTGRAALGVAGALLSVLPFFHPLHALVAGVALALAAMFELGRRRFGRGVAWLLLAPLPFYVLFVVVYSSGRHGSIPFVLDLTSPRLGERGVFFLRHVGLLLVPAIAGLVWWKDPEAHGRSLRPEASALIAVPSALALLFHDTYGNYHWAFDTLAVGLAIASGVGLSRLVAARRTLGLIVAAAVLATAIADAGYRRRVVSDLEWLTSARAVGSPDENAVGRWIRESTPPDAVFAVEPSAPAAVATVVALGERRLLLGPDYLIRTTTTKADVAALVRDNRAVLLDPCAAARRNDVSFVLLENRRIPADLRAAWARTVAFETPEMIVFSVAAARAACR